MEIKKWRRENGERFRYDYPELSTHSRVLDVGGYRGDWAAGIHAKYGCYVYIIEPINRFANAIEKRFKENKKILVINGGMWLYDGRRPMFINGDRSGCRTNGDMENTNVMDARTIINRTMFDLVKINIEGDEYELLNYLICCGAIENISHIQIQFHEFVPNASAYRKHIRDLLSITHDCQWSYLFVWESWKRKA